MGKRKRTADDNDMSRVQYVKFLHDVYGRRGSVITYDFRQVTGNPDSLPSAASMWECSATSPRVPIDVSLAQSKSAPPSMLADEVCLPAATVTVQAPRKQDAKDSAAEMLWESICDKIPEDERLRTMNPGAAPRRELTECEALREMGLALLKGRDSELGPFLPLFPSSGDPRQLCIPLPLLVPNYNSVAKWLACVKRNGRATVAELKEEHPETRLAVFERLLRTLEPTEGVAYDAATKTLVLSDLPEPEGMEDEPRGTGTERPAAPLREAAAEETPGPAPAPRLATISAVLLQAGPVLSMQEVEVSTASASEWLRSVGGILQCDPLAVMRWSRVGLPITAPAGLEAAAKGAHPVEATEMQGGLRILLPSAKSDEPVEGEGGLRPKAPVYPLQEVPQPYMASVLYEGGPDPDLNVVASYLAGECVRGPVLLYRFKFNLKPNVRAFDAEPLRPHQVAQTLARTCPLGIFWEASRPAGFGLALPPSDYCDHPAASGQRPFESLIHTCHRLLGMVPRDRLVPGAGAEAASKVPSPFGLLPPAALFRAECALDGVPISLDDVLMSRKERDMEQRGAGPKSASAEMEEAEDRRAPAPDWDHQDEEGEDGRGTTAADKEQWTVCLSLTLPSFLARHLQIQGQGGGMEGAPVTLTTEGASDANSWIALNQASCKMMLQLQGLVAQMYGRQLCLTTGGSREAPALTASEIEMLPQEDLVDAVELELDWAACVVDRSTSVGHTPLEKGGVAVLLLTCVHPADNTTQCKFQVTAPVGLGYLDPALDQLLLDPPASPRAPEDEGEPDASPLVRGNSIRFHHPLPLRFYGGASSLLPQVGVTSLFVKLVYHPTNSRRRVPPEQSVTPFSPTLTQQRHEFVASTLRRVRGLPQESPLSSLVDLGCSEGRSLCFLLSKVLEGEALARGGMGSGALASSPGIRIGGVDRDPMAAARAKRRLAKALLRHGALQAQERGLEGEGGGAGAGSTEGVPSPMVPSVTSEGVPVEVVVETLDMFKLQEGSADVVTCIEVIEHLPFHQATTSLPDLILGRLSPKVAIITTPNYAYNYLLPPGQLAGPAVAPPMTVDPSLPSPHPRLRHPDHKFELSASQFQSWAMAVVSKYPGYDVHVTTLGFMTHPETGQPIGAATGDMTGTGGGQGGAVCCAVFMKKGLTLDLAEEASCPATAELME